MSSRNRRLWDEHAQRHPDDLFAQVRRTVKGKPIDALQHEMILAKIREALALQQQDYVLDLCCGNGLISSAIFAASSGGVGVDFSQVLIDVARERFPAASVTYLQEDVAAFCKQTPAAPTFTKAFSYGSLQYLEDDDVRAVLKSLYDRFLHLTRFFIGNHVDRDRLQYFIDRSHRAGSENETDTPIGKWRTREEVASMAESAGWHCHFSRMPDDFYGAGYRFDALLTRRP